MQGLYSATYEWVRRGCMQGLYYNSPVQIKVP